MNDHHLKKLTAHEILSGYERVEKFLPLSSHDINLTASASDVLVIVETFPER